MNVEFVKDRRTRVLRIAFGAVLTALAAAVVTGIVTAPTRADRTASSAAAQRALTVEEAFEETRVRRQATPEAARVAVAASLADECTTGFTWTHPSDPTMCDADPTLSGCTKTCTEVTADG